MENSPIGKLPKELRDQITEYALTAENGVVVLPKYMRHDRTDLNQEETEETQGYVRQFAPMLRPTWSQTCRQAREESGSLYFSLNSFEFTWDKNFKFKHVIARAALDKISVLSVSEFNAQAIRNIHIDLGYFFDYQLHTNDHKPAASLAKTIRCLWEMTSWCEYSNAAITAKIAFVFPGDIIRLSPEGQSGGQVRNQSPHHHDWLVDKDVFEVNLSFRDMVSLDFDELIDQALQSLIDMHLTEDATKELKDEAKRFSGFFKGATLEYLSSTECHWDGCINDHDLEEIDSEDERQNEEARQEMIYEKRMERD